MGCKSWEGGLRSTQMFLSPSAHVTPCHVQLSLEHAGRCIRPQYEVHQQLSQSL